MKHLPKRIFLDTNIFEAHNFLDGTSIHGIFNYAKEKFIKIYMTEISYNELLSRIRKNLEKVKVEHNIYVNKINSSRILRNVGRFKDIEKYRFAVEDTYNEIKLELDKLIKCSNVEFIEYKDLNINEIFHMYYNSLPPFSKKEEKKHEFPDAFIIKTIDKWCEQNSSRMIFVTKDKDFNGYSSNRIIFKNDLNELLKDITEYYDYKKNTEIIPNIDLRIIKFKSELLEMIDERIEEKIIYDIDFEKYGDISRSKPKYLNHKVTSIYHEYANVSFEVETMVKFRVFPTHLDIYDDFPIKDFRPKLLSESLLITCIIPPEY